MQVGILGPLTVAADGRQVEIGGARLRRLLILLALEVGRTVTVEALTDALWADTAPTDPTNAVQSLVSRLRRALPATSALHSAHGGYRLELPREAVDAYRFERLAREGQRALRAGDPATATSCLAEALSLWRGPALADASDTRYAAAAAARLEELRLSALEDRAEADLVSGRADQLVAEMEELAARHPLRERTRALLMNALYATGRQAEALRSYEDFRARLAEELGVDPSPRVRDLHVAMLRRDPALTPAAVPLTRAAPAGAPAATSADRPGPPQAPGPATRPGNLRAPLTTFVGRDAELRRLAGQLRDGRLVTLVGPGGAGKTRLATTLAGTLADAHPGGAWLVELAAVTDPDDVPQVVVRALGLREAGLLEGPGPRDLLDQLVEAFSVAPALLVLDNCEHLVDAAARLVDELLGRCPELRIVATSREPLGIAGEALCPVPPLALPAPAATVAEAVESPAVQLFVNRAVAVRPGFAVTDANVAAVCEVCRRLDGLPLAVELAAARTRTLPVEELAARLSDRFRLLTGGSRTAMPRHRTLRAVVAWSWDLLEPDERRLAQRLAVFPGAVTPESAARLCDLPPAIAPAALDLLAALVDKSLLQRLDGPHPRYRMLETIREYGLERLAEQDEVGAARRAHAEYFLELSERAELRLRGPEQLVWLPRLAAERENLLAAFHFACDTGDAAVAVRLAAAVSPLWTVQGNHAEAAAWLRAVLELPGEAPPAARRAATAAYLFNTVLTGGRAGGDLPIEALLARLPDRAEPDDHPVAALLDPALAFLRADAAAGLAAIARLRDHPDAWARGTLMLMAALLHGQDGDTDAMRADLAEAAAAFRATGDRWGLAMALTFEAHVHLVLGDFPVAMAAAEEAGTLLHTLDATADAALQRILLAVALIWHGDLTRARDELRALVAPAARPVTARYLVLAHLWLGHLARYDGAFDEAARAYDRARADLERITFDAALYRAMHRCAAAQLAVAQGDQRSAWEHLAAAFALAAEPGYVPVLAEIGVAAAAARLACGEAELAAELLGAASSLHRGPDSFHPDATELGRRLADVLGGEVHATAVGRGRARDRADALALIDAQVRRR
ncbi:MULTISPECIES: BTAD domain-containing putative transcriptional regulator [Micromonospora]|nr:MULTISPECIES: BTAD domain-containing putative transcriptional regulator [Micromonospora]NES15063.1 AfsR/SARP family transcriptional regulator [Micromonospora sp. PPF5-17B]NES38867.1 AfsR/SARP family transcriptional regulator [Micromonospora solifontis]NES56262.1 AfsR/SARP family transcriptional regulator [Micromonospora sp. PPF5-6]